MKLIIDISEEDFNEAKMLLIEGVSNNIEYAVANGKPYEETPKGDLISREALKKHKVYLVDSHEYVVPVYNIDNAPTVLHDNYSMGYQDGVRKVLSERPQGEITNEDIQNAIKQGYKDGYEMAKAKYENRPQGECEKCTYRIFTEKFADSIAEVMTQYGITSIEELQARLQEEMRGGENEKVDK